MFKICVIGCGFMAVDGHGPVKFTKELSIDIIKKGYNIILEKPPGLNTEEID